MLIESCKEELAWAADKQQLKNRAVLNLKHYCVHCYVALVTYSNYFEIVSTVWPF